ncbi:uncharacterized protein [Arachis hypogaea]|uniref:uncharacterized protein n=1 Tax=Arachis hypogaea TaxID=3818 RepID=UPI003B20FD4A
MWRQVITRFGIPEVVISDNETQFTDKKLIELLNGLGIKQKFSSVEHPQTNGQFESANKVILQGLKKRLVLHGRNPLPPDIRGGRDDTRENRRVEPATTSEGVEKAVEKDLVDEAREMAHLTEVALKQMMALRYNAKVLKREFGKNDLVLQRNDIGLPTQGEGKLAANWEGLYRVKDMLGKGAYKLEKLDGKEIPRTWNTCLTAD